MVPDMEEQWGMSGEGATVMPGTLLIISFALFKDSVT